MKHPEHDLQRTVVKMLPRILKPSVFFCAINPLPGRDARAGAQAKQLGVRSGVPDLLFIHRGFSLWIELKAGTGKLSRSQVTAVDDLAAAHSNPTGTATGAVDVCWSLDGVRDVLGKYGMTRERGGR